MINNIDRSGYRDSVVKPAEKQKLLPSTGSGKHYGGTSIVAVNQVAVGILKDLK